MERLEQEQRRQIEQLYMEMFGQLFAYARSIMGNDAPAEEAVQETFRIACLRPGELCSSPNPRGWLFNTLKNVLKNTQRAQDSARRLLAEYTALYGQSPLSTRDPVCLEVTYENLKDKPEFQLLYAWAVQGKTLLELSQELGISLSACKKRIQRAKAALKKKL